jgi:hypothetical protein
MVGLDPPIAMRGSTLIERAASALRSAGPAQRIVGREALRTTGAPRL